MFLLIAFLLFTVLILFLLLHTGKLYHKSYPLAKVNMSTTTSKKTPNHFTQLGVFIHTLIYRSGITPPHPSFLFCFHSFLGSIHKLIGAFDDGIDLIFRSFINRHAIRDRNFFFRPEIGLFYFVHLLNKNI